MTLPFISYGGSSLIAMAFAMGLVLALARRRPKAVMPAGGFSPHRRRLVGRPDGHLTCAQAPWFVVVAAGGTGGHLFPAQALAEVLVKRGYLIHLMSDERAAPMAASFPPCEIHRIPSATLSLRRPWRLPRQALRLLRGYRSSRKLLARLEPMRSQASADILPSRR